MCDHVFDWKHDAANSAPEKMATPERPRSSSLMSVSRFVGEAGLTTRPPTSRRAVVLGRPEPQNGGCFTKNLARSFASMGSGPKPLHRLSAVASVALALHRSDGFVVVRVRSEEIEELGQPSGGVAYGRVA